MAKALTGLEDDRKKAQNGREIVDVVSTKNVNQFKLDGYSKAPRKGIQHEGTAHDRVQAERSISR